MPLKISPYDPDAAVQFQAVAAQTADRVAALLQRKADRADALREVAAAQSDTNAFRAAAALDREVLLLIELVQDYKRWGEQLLADNESAWAMIALQDRRCEALKRFAGFCKEEAEASNRQFFQLHRAFTAYVERHQAA